MALIRIVNRIEYPSEPKHSPTPQSEKCKHGFQKGSAGSYCPCHSATPPKESKGWEESYWSLTEGRCVELGIKITPELTKVFNEAENLISFLLEEQRKEYVRRIEKLIRKDISRYERDDDDYRDIGYNKAIDDILNLLNN